MHKWSFLVIAGLALLLFQPLCAQKEGAVWYFGSHAGLDFNLQYPRPLTDGQIDTREGVASICDKDGKLLFYTDGQTVYDRTHQIMNNGEGLLGDKSSTQSSVVVPKPGSTTQYYIFTVDQAGTPSNPGNGLNYSIVDISLSSGLGSVIQRNIKLPWVPNVLFTEKITVVKHKDGKSYWIIAHEFDTWEFYEFLLTEKDGLTLYDAIGAGSYHKFDPNDRDNRGALGYLKSSPKGDFLATAIEGLHFFELFTFNNLTGDIRMIAKLPAGDSQNPFAETGAAYGVEFSPTSNFLYGSTRKGGLLYQWNLAKLDQDSILYSVKILRENPSILCGALQLAYNGKIYLSLGNQPFLGVINSPIQEDCNYIEHGASLIDNSTGKGGTGYFGLPTFLSDFFKAAEFYFENTCYRDKTVFYISTRAGVDLNVPPVWTIKKNGNDVGQAVTDPVTWEGVYTFPAPGVYMVNMRIIQFGGVRNFEREITIHPLPDLNLPDITPLCKGSPALLDAGDGAFYNWREFPNLKVERRVNVYNPRTYLVTVTHYNGCSSTDSTEVVEKPLPVIKDTLITLAACGAGNGSITLVMEEDPDQYDFAWTHDSANTSNTATNLAFGVYEVKITSRHTGCSLTSKLSVSEENAPAVSIRSSITGTACPGSKVTLTAQGAVEYLWENPNGIRVPSLDVYPWKTTTYRVKGYSVEQATQDTCSAYGEITVEVFPYNPPQLGAPREGCQGDTIKLDGGSEYLAWKWSNNETTRVVQITQSIEQLIVFVTDKNQCVLTDTTKVLIKPLPEINLGNDSIIQCKGSPIELFGGWGDSYLWSTGDTTAKIQVNESDNYKLTIQKNGCVNTDSVQVTIKPLPEVNLHLPQDTTICLKDSLELNGGRGETYLWSTGDTTRYKYVNQSGVYWLKIKIDGCENSDTVNLTINPLPKVDLGRDTVYCKSNPIVLSGGSGDSYLWSTGAITPEISINETGTFDLSITKNGCVNSDTVMIRVNDPSLLIIDSVTSIPVTCSGNRDGSLKIYSHGSGSSYEFSIDDGLNYSTSPWFQGLYGNNSFQIVVREDKACTTKYPKEITFKEPDSIQINYHLVSPSCETCPDGEINLSIKGGTPPYSVKWSTNDTITYLSNMVLGKYLVWVTDASKCRENALIDLTLDYPPFQIPNAFTPNGDGINEKWEIAALKDFPECELKIFNRSGKLIWWSETGYPVPWDGTDKSGTILPVGSYYYLVWLRSDLKPLKGSVSILR